MTAVFVLRICAYGENMCSRDAVGTRTNLGTLPAWFAASIERRSSASLLPTAATMSGAPDVLFAAGGVPDVLVPPLHPTINESAARRPPRKPLQHSHPKDYDLYRLSS